MIELSKDRQARGVDLVVLDQGIDNSTVINTTFFQILGAVAEFEHALTSERTRDGLEPDPRPRRRAEAEGRPPPEQSSA